MERQITNIILQWASILDKTKTSIIIFLSKNLHIRLFCGNFATAIELMAIA